MPATPDPQSVIDRQLAAHGSAIGSFAYLMLQHQADAQRILAATLASARMHGDRPTDADDERLRLLRIAARKVLRGAPQSGEVAPLLPDPTSTSDRLAILTGLGELDPRSRMAIVLHYVLNLPPDEVARVLEDDPVALRSDLHEARNRLLAWTTEADARDSPATRDPFDARLARALQEEAGRFQPVADLSRLRPPDQPGPGSRRRSWWALGLLSAMAVALTAFFALVPATHPASNEQARSSAEAAPPRTSPAPITLASCDIAPADSSLAFSGWTTLAALHVHGGEAGPGQPVYAIITSGLAEWVGWQKSYSGPMFPAPVGRMGCIYDPSQHASSLVGVDADWQPNILADGCPPSPIDQFGGYRETGGPRAWLLLPQDTASWYVGDFSYLLLFRLSPPAAPGQTITAWAQPLANASPIRGEIDSTSGKLSGRPDTSGSGTRYYFVNLRFTRPGCWVINIALDGQVVGSAIAPIEVISGQSVPRPAPTVP